MNRMALLMLTASLCVPGVSRSEETGSRSEAGGPHLKLAMVTTDRYSRNEKTVFTPDVQKIFAVYQVAGAAQGTRLKAVWIGEKVDGLAAKSKITESESTFSAKGEYMGSFSCSKPPQGWWAGTYLVELSVDGTVRKTLAFRVEKP
jgi:hypothetical protein